MYIYGCATCGRTGRHVRRAMTYCRNNELDLEIKYSKDNDENREEHATHLIQGGIQGDGYAAIVVQDGKVTRLSEWNI